MRTLLFISGVLFAAFNSAAFGSVASAQAEAAPLEEGAQKNELKIHGALGRGGTIDTGEHFSLNLGGRVALRYELEAARDPINEGASIAHRPSVSNLRLGLGGHLLRRTLTYRVQLNLSPLSLRGGKESPIYDAYLSYAPREDLSVRVGQFFVPFNRLRTINDWALQLGARSIAVREFSLDRDLGVRISADRLLGERSPVTMHLGIFGGDGTIDYVWKQPGALLVSRVELRPLGHFDDGVDGDLARRDAPALAIGAAFAANINASKHQSNRGAALIEGTRHFLHASADLIFKWRGFAVQSELILRRSTIPAAGSGQREQAEATRDGYGATAQLSYIFREPIELVARISAIEAWKDADPDFIQSASRAGRELGFGINYYLRGHHLKVQTDYAATAPPGFVFAHAGHIARVQIDASF